MTDRPRPDGARPPVASPLGRWAILAGAAVVVACSSGGEASPSASAGSSTAPSPAASIRLPATVIDPIVADAAGRLSVDPATVVVTLAEPQTFSDGSLGCPEPGMVYIQVVTDGYRVVLTAADATLDYRGTGPGAFRLCSLGIP